MVASKTSAINVMPRPRKPKKRKLTKSEQMARVRTRNTAPEQLLRIELWRRGYRYRLNVPLPGRPDLVFVKARVVVFVDGCFWHGCPLHYRQPATNPEFWYRKLQRNRRRDREVERALAIMGWCVVRLWEHEIEDDLDLAINKVTSAIATVSLLDSARCE